MKGGLPARRAAQEKREADLIHRSFTLSTNHWARERKLLEKNGRGVGEVSLKKTKNNNDQSLHAARHYLGSR